MLDRCCQQANHTLVLLTKGDTEDELTGPEYGLEPCREGFSQRQIAGATSYDGLIAACARKGGARRILTFTRDPRRRVSSSPSSPGRQGGGWEKRAGVMRGPRSSGQAESKTRHSQNGASQCRDGMRRPTSCDAVPDYRPANRVSRG